MRGLTSCQVHTFKPKYWVGHVPVPKIRRGIGWEGRSAQEGGRGRKGGLPDAGRERNVPSPSTKYVLDMLPYPRVEENAAGWEGGEDEQLSAGYFSSQVLSAAYPSPDHNTLVLEHPLSPH